jgi:hypothetical protein
MDTMKKNFWIILLIAANILVIGAVLIWYCNRSYPLIGHDNRLFMPYLLDSFLHQKINGLSTQWYTPTFAGGRPVYSNPQDFQYSLPQFLLWIADPWTSILGSMIVYITIGFVAAYYFLKRLLGYSSFSSILGAVFFIGNGFYFQHMSVGHLTFQTFTLFPLIMIIVIHPRLPHWLGGLLLSLVCAVLLYSGFHNFTFFILTGLVFFPLLYLLNPALFQWKRILAVGLWGSLFTLLLCGSKLSAIYHFMRFFPRAAQDNYDTNLLTGFVGAVRQLLGTMNLAPIYRALRYVDPGASPYQSVADMFFATGTRVLGYWELDASLSPSLILLLGGGAFSYLFRGPGLKTGIDKKRLVAIACLVLGIWLVIEFTLAKGFIYPAIRHLPILSSQQANVRNICAFIFPLAVVGAAIFHKWTKNWKSDGRVLKVYLLLNGLALVSLLSFRFVPTKYTIDQRLFVFHQCDYPPLAAIYDQIRFQGETFPVKNVIRNATPMEVIPRQGVSTIDPYNTFFEDITRYITALHEGSVYDITDGYYNIIDPTGYIFPEVNHSLEYERMSVSDEDKFLDFIHRRQPKWNLPVVQQALDKVSLLTLISEFLLIIGYWAIERGRIHKHINPVIKSD